MSREFSGRRNLESLKKEAKRWLAALGDDAGGARARLLRALPDAPELPTLRDVQLALAREQGFAGWAALKRALTPDPSASAKSLEHYEAAVQALLDAYRTGTPEAMERHYRYTWHRRGWQSMRTYVQLDLGRRADGEEDDPDITPDDARYLIAIEHGFERWDALLAFVSAVPGGMIATAKPVRVRSLDPSAPSGGSRTRDWHAALRQLRGLPSPMLEAEGQMTDALLIEVADVERLEGLNLAGSKAVSDDGLRHLSRLTNLRHLDLAGTAITDRGLAVLRTLPRLETLSLAMTQVTDAGLTHLAACEQLREVDLSWTRSGDGAIRALAGKVHIRGFRSGNGVTDAGLALLHELPVFRTWQGGDVAMSLLSSHASPSHLQLRGPFTDAGLRQLRGLDGLFALNLDASDLAITAAGMAPLAALPNLGRLAVDAKDDWMPAIAEMPRLRFLLAQDTTATDAGFAALARSRSIELIWGRRCHNLGRRGFQALSEMPSLRGLSVSCLNVDDAGLSSLPMFPALKELMPMDVPDAGYRHVGKCAGLESLVLMYCRNTTDAATEQIAGLRLSSYFNSYTTITDRTPEILSRMDSLERVTLDTCHGVTDAGVAQLARLPRLRELRVSGKGVTNAVDAVFPRSL